MAGKIDQAKGAIKDAWGSATGDKEMQAEGKMDKAKGKAKELAEDAKDAAKGVANSIDKG